MTREMSAPRRRIWQHDWYPSFRLRRALSGILSREQLLSAGSRIADIGCGGSPYKDIFVSGGASYVGCDIDGNPDVILSPGKAFPFTDESFDGVLSFQVLEHVWDINWYLGECRRILKKDGWLLLSTHGVWLYHPHPADYRRWTCEGLRKELAAHEFKSFIEEALIGPLAWTTLFQMYGIREVFKRIPFVGNILMFFVALIVNFLLLTEDLITPAWIRDENASIYLTVSRK